MNFFSAQIIPSLLLLAIGYLGCNVTLVLITWFFAVTVITAAFAGAMTSAVDMAPNLAGKESGFGYDVWLVLIHVKGKISLH
jgi:hypothetical protein